MTLSLILDAPVKPAPPAETAEDVLVVVVNAEHIARGLVSANKCPIALAVGRYCRMQTSGYLTVDKGNTRPELYLNRDAGNWAGTFDTGGSDVVHPERFVFRRVK